MMLLVDADLVARGRSKSWAYRRLPRRFIRRRRREGGILGVGGSPPVHSPPGRIGVPACTLLPWAYRRPRLYILPWAYRRPRLYTSPLGV
jgi:hypothetical protein